MKKWKVNKPNMHLVSEFSKRCDLNRLVLEIMTSRGIDRFEQVIDFFKGEELSDPFMMIDMQNAVDTISEAVNNFDLICVYGDYDCDGVTATAILYDYLLNIGADVIYYIPQRSEGYGMNVNAVEKLHELGVKLIVTVDNGISAFNEAERIAELGMKLVVTDHHQPGERLPKAEAVVDPHRQDCPSYFKDLSGAGVALKLCAALDDGNYDMIMEQYSDICAVGTIADIVPLNGENRTIVQNGLMYLKNTENFGLNFLMDKSGVDRNRISSSGVAFQIAPRINAAGRFGSPLTAVKALLSESEEDADNYTDMLVSLNNKRKEAENNIMSEIFTYIDENPQILNQRVLVISGHGWHRGVIGIVSAKMLECFGKPNIVISVDEDGIGRGSARSVHGFSIFKCFSYAEEYLEQFGGHECAGGLTVKESNIQFFTEKVLEYADGFEQMPAAELVADKLIMPEDFTVNNIKSLSVMEPFGENNSEPLFAMSGARVDRIFSLSQGKHSKIDVTYGGVKTQVLMFFQSPESLPFGIGDKIDLMVNISINFFAGNETISVKAVDYRIHGVNQDKYFAAKDCYEKYCRGERLPISFLNKINPDRQELVKVYKTIMSLGEVSFDRLYMKLLNPSMNYCKLKLCVDAFSELGLVKFIPSSQKVVIMPVKTRVDIESSEVLKKLSAEISRGGN
ncbi:MAG: single-stranded-DNA-specific exonuclease RecJ [Oscillospiraceae bacterium]